MRNVLFLCSLLIVIVFFAACNEIDETETTETETTITHVEVEKVTKGNLVTEDTIYGHTVPYKQTPIMMQQPGEITDIKVENGDEVKKDERIGTLKTQMGSLAIKAPMEGEIAQLTLEKDDMYDGESPIAVVFDDETIVVQFTVTPGVKAKLKKDKTYETVINDKTYDATIKRIEKLPNESGQFDVEAHIVNEKGKIAIGAIAELIIENVHQKDVLLIPTEAIVTEGEETFIYIAGDFEAKKVTIEVIESQTDVSAIKGDIKKGEKVVTSGQFLLTDGSEIEVVKDGK